MKKKKHEASIVFYFLLILIFLCIVFELLENKFNISMLRFISCGVGVILTCSIIPLVVAHIYEKYKGDSKKEPKNKRGKESYKKLKGLANPNKDKIFLNMLITARDVFADFVHDAAHSKFTVFIIVALIMVYVPAVSAHYGMGEKVLDIIKNDDPAEHVGDTEIVPKGPTGPVTVEEKPFLMNPERDFVLSDEECNKLYFLTGKYCIDDWTEDNIRNIVGSYISSLVAEQRPDLFNDDVPEAIKAEVDYASQLEKSMTTSDEMETVISIRKNVWSKYPSPVFATLLSAAQQRYALEYTDIQGEFKTIEYYYAYAIVWSLEVLRFACTDSYDRKQILAFISMRYHDIEAAAPDGGDAQKRAGMLSDAFEWLENSQ